ncbi:MAG: hypothetical protein Q4Q06_02825, partial [Bacteroidota bacterium]|nr:hypothetical protein [Bacteroidota bacterium]
MRGKIFIITLVVFFCLNVTAQRFNGFSNNIDDYIANLEELYKTDANMKKEQKKDWETLMLQYDSVWNTFSSSHKKDVLKLSQLMLKKNIRARNGFYDFLLTQIAFTSSNQSQESYNQWLKGMYKYLSAHNIAIYNKAMETTYNLLAHNCLYLSKTTRWAFEEGASYIFREDTLRGVYADFSSPININYSSTSDANTIYNTVGRLYLMEENWEGNFGVVTWEKAGLNKDSVFVTLNKYNVALKT